MIQSAGRIACTVPNLPKFSAYYPRLSFLNSKLTRLSVTSVMLACGCSWFFPARSHSVHCDTRRETVSSDSLTVNRATTNRRDTWEDIVPSLFSHISQEYDELGQIARGEEAITVEPSVFAQIGVLKYDAVRALCFFLQQRLSGPAVTETTASVRSPLKFPENFVFCDIGSGVGNVCLQVLCETSCSRVIGIEVIPSRNRCAREAFAVAQQQYPDIFNSGKDARFYTVDLVNSERVLAEEKVNVVFTHSWMFDDELMCQLTSLVLNSPTIEMVVTSRPLDSNVLQNYRGRVASNFELLHSESATLEHEKMMRGAQVVEGPPPTIALAADWTDRSPFYVYRRSLAK